MPGCEVLAASVRVIVLIRHGFYLSGKCPTKYKRELFSPVAFFRKNIENAFAPVTPVLTNATP